jgi:hypothetical protein
MQTTAVVASGWHPGALRLSAPVASWLQLCSFEQQQLSSLQHLSHAENDQHIKANML